MVTGSVSAPQPALGALAGGMRAASDHLDQAAGQVASGGPDPDSMVGMMLARIEMQACASGFRTASETEGSLIDVLA